MWEHNNITTIKLKLSVTGGNLRISEMKPMQKCLKPVFSLLTSRRGLHWLQKEVNAKITLFLA